MNTNAEQFYPTYKAQHRDILLLEFEEAQKIANGQSKIYTQVTNILIAVATLTITYFLHQNKNEEIKRIEIFLSNSILFTFILFIFGMLLLRYFVDLQKQITINARKVVTLRTLLGLDYGHIQLTLPNWRVEGATNPFVIKFFNGWFSFTSSPFWLLTVTINAIWWYSTKDKEIISIEILDNDFVLYWFWGNLIITITYLFCFRRNLNDRHETVYLNIIKMFSSLLRIKLVDNFEYVIYRAKLANFELVRLKVNFEKLSLILREIEDKRFFYHKFGISIKSLIRGTLSRFKFFRKKFGIIEHGGSTITMQLARTLFIPSNQNKYLRKIIELLLSIWLDRQFTKSEILKLYIASVRFEKGILGLSNAIKYFFGELKAKDLTTEEAFFLVERLSNISSTIDRNRIEYLAEKIQIPIDKKTLNTIYNKQVKNEKLIFLS